MNDLQQGQKKIRFKLQVMTQDAQRRHRRALKQQLEDLTHLFELLERETENG